MHCHHLWRAIRSGQRKLARLAAARGDAPKTSPVFVATGLEEQNPPPIRRPSCILNALTLLKLQQRSRLATVGGNNVDDSAANVGLSARYSEMLAVGRYFKVGSIV